MGFFKTVKDSIYSPEFYQGITQRSLLSAMGYFLLLSFLLTILQSILPIASFITVGQKEVEKFVSSVVNAYPSELEVQIKNGKVSTNVPEPYYIPIPSYMDDGKNTDYKNIVVIDTKTPFSASQFNNYKTLAWVGLDSAFVKGDNGQIRTIDLSKSSNMEINKPIIDSFVKKFSPLLKLLTPIVIVCVLFGIFFLHLLRLVYLFFLAFLVFMLLKLLKQEKTYGSSYKISLFAVTLGMIFELVAEFIHFPGFPFLFTIISLAVVWFNFSAQKKSVSPIKKSR